jgi:ABC-type transport system substrate-binding protein
MNEGIKLTKNTDYWKPGGYLDGIEYTIIPTARRACCPS